LPPLSVSKLVSKSPLITTSQMQGSTPTKSRNHENVGDFDRLRSFIQILASFIPRRLSKSMKVRYQTPKQTGLGG
ncbi:hypothetical protein, partial [Novosphingobium silvae]|uniref:hypothetical protein n=1 Tax=Novosphingobium silvae TaxID=2692619 RepID=UPI001F44E259